MARRVVLDIENVWKSYNEGRVHALRGITLKVHEGDFMAVMGPSGSGKSTFMNIMGLLDVPTSGKVILDGRDVSKLSEDQLADIRGKKIGFIFQQFNLIPTLTAIENVMLPVIFQGGKDSEKKARALKLLEEIGLKERANHLPRQLSGGEQQRVAIARSLINDPEYILADEPTGNLDSKTGESIMKILEELHHRGKTLIVITHDPRIAGFAHEMATIIDGQLTHKNISSPKEYLWSKT
jgi:putative ABC transport system ATP-binding protein